MRMHAVSSNNTPADCLHVMCGFRGVDPHPLKNHKNIGFLSNTGPDPIKNTKLPSQHSMLGHHRRADDGPLLVVFSILSPLIN